MRMLHEENNVFTGDGTTQRLLGITIRIPGGGFKPHHTCLNYI